MKKKNNKIKVIRIIIIDFLRQISLQINTPISFKARQRITAEVNLIAVKKRCCSVLFNCTYKLNQSIGVNVDKNKSVFIN